MNALSIFRSLAAITLLAVAPALPQADPLDPQIQLVNPQDGQKFRLGKAINLTAAVTDTSPIPFEVHYLMMLGSGPDWVDIGNSAEGPSFAVSWTPPATGSIKLRAEIMELGLTTTATSQEVGIEVMPVNIGPVVSLSAPVQGALFTYPANVTIGGTASDQDLPENNNGLDSIALFQNDRLITRFLGGAFPSYTWTGMQPGRYKLQAKAWDLDGQEGSSPIVDIVVNDVPACSLTVSPAGPYVAPVNFTLTATVSDKLDSVVKVVFYRDNVALDSATHAPWSYSGTVNQAGAYSLTAKAFDNLGATRVSSPIPIKIAGNQPPVARAGADIFLNSAATLANLDGSASSDPENQPLTFAWKSNPNIDIKERTAAKATADFSKVGPGVYTLTLEVTDAGSPGLKSSDDMIVTVGKAPKITSPLSASGQVGKPFSYAPEDGGIPQSSYTFTNRPAGLVWDTLTRTLRGTPISAGTSTVSMTAANAAGSDTKVLTLAIYEAPRLTKDLKDTLTLTQKSTLTLSVTAAGSPAPNYQWQYQGSSGGFINVGANTATYSIDSVAVTQSGNYRVIVSNGYPPADTSVVCKVTVKPLPKPIVITTQPTTTPLNLAQGASVTFMVKATGDPVIKYQWFHDDKPVKATAGVGDTIFRIDSVTLGDNGSYRARITHGGPDTVWSNTASLLVHLIKLPPPYFRPKDSLSFSKSPYTITLGCDSPFVQIYYTLNNKTPTQTVSSTNFKYNGSVKIDSSRVLKARAWRAGFDSSSLLTASFTYSPPGTLPSPIIKPPLAHFSSTVRCTLQTDAGNEIYYSRNGSSLVKYDSVFTILSTTTVKAIARKAGWLDSPPQEWTFIKDSTQITADVPAPTPAAKTFSGHLDVVLKSNPDAFIRYTTDKTDPEGSPTADSMASGGTISLSRTTLIRAYAYGPKYKASKPVSLIYTLVPGPITANPPSDSAFTNSITVTLAAVPGQAAIYYTTNDSLPLDNLGRLQPGARLYVPPGIFSDSSFTITAIALYDSVQSQPYRFGYTKAKAGGRLATPVAITAGNVTGFFDSLTITLTAVKGSEIHYTLNGDRPTPSSPKFDKPFTIDSSTLVQAQAYQPSFLDSKLLVASYTLMPDTPSISKSGGSYSSRQEVYLSARSKRTPILYTLDNEDPGPGTGILYTGKPIIIDSSTTLKAVTISGNLVSRVQERVYEIFDTRDTTLAPGQSYYLQGGYVLTNPEDQGSPVHVRLGKSDSLGLQGFQDVQYSMTFSLPPGVVTGFPSLTLSKPDTEKRLLYKAQKPGAVYFIGASDSIVISEAGDYFLGEDVSPPVITYRGETIGGPDDSTEVKFHIEDNVMNLSYDIRRSDDPTRNVTQVNLLVPADLEVRLKNEPGNFGPLQVQLAVHDYRVTTYLPAIPPNMLSLSQALPAVVGPNRWSIGGSFNLAYDLISVPIAYEHGLTLADLAPGANVSGLIFNNRDSLYHAMAPTDSLVPGGGYFVGSLTPILHFSHGPGRTKPRGPENYTVRLKAGWNQIGNPHMERLFWPAPRYEEPGSKVPRESYARSLVKGLWAYHPDRGEFTESDSLNPWRGYFVFNYGRDTVVTLSPTPIRRGALKRENAGPSVILSLGWARSQGVTLGAVSFAADGLGREDETELPGRSGYRLRALRDGHPLASDWVRFNRGGVLTWKVALSGKGSAVEAAAQSAVARSAGESRDGVAPVEPPLLVSSLEMPPGFEAWIVSESRNMKFPLRPGSQIAPSGLASDTLTVLAGPAEELAKLAYLNGKNLTAPALDASVIARPPGFILRLSLPVRSDVRARLWEMRGKCLAEFHPGALSEGTYRFDSANFRKLGAAPGPGLYFLTIETRSAASHAHLTKKVLLRD